MSNIEYENSNLSNINLLYHPGVYSVLYLSLSLGFGSLARELEKKTKIPF